MNINVIRDLLKAYMSEPFPGGIVSKALVNILQPHASLTKSDVTEFHRLITSIAKKADETVRANFVDRELNKAEYNSAMVEQLLNDILLEVKAPILADASDQDLARLIQLVILGGFHKYDHFSELLKQATGELLTNIEPLFTRETQYRILNSLLDPTTQKIPMNPIFYQSESINPSKPSGWLMMDDDAVQGMLAADSEARGVIHTLEQQSMSLALILDKTLADSDEPLLSRIMDKMLLQMNTDLPVHPSEDGYHQHWSELNRLNTMLEKTALIARDGLSNQLRALWNLSVRRAVLEEEQKKCIALIGQISTQDGPESDRLAKERFLSELIKTNERLINELEAIPREANLDLARQGILSKIELPEQLLDYIWSSNGDQIYQATRFLPFDRHECRTLFGGVIQHLESKGWKQSADREGLLYSHYQKRYDEQTALYTEQEKRLVVSDDNGRTHRLSDNELRHPLDKTCVLRNPEPCVHFRDLLVACSINGDFAGLKRRQSIRTKIEQLSYSPSSATANELAFFDDIDAFLANQAPGYLTRLEAKYKAYIAGATAVDLSLTPTQLDALRAFPTNAVRTATTTVHASRGNASPLFFRPTGSGGDRASDQSVLDQEEKSQSPGPRHKS